MRLQPSIAVLSLACRFPDATSPAELWANILEGRRSFRPIPAERLDVSQYAADVLGEADSITPIQAGLLTNWSFNRASFRVPKSTFEATDLSHWLALELSAQAIESIGGVEQLDRDRTAVVVANTLTGEFSRASLLRLRAPFLDDILARCADRMGISSDACERLRRDFTAELRGRFPDPNEDSLAGGLANTIAGRIANYFDLHGGAYTVDGACASSLVAVADACNLLASEQVDAVVVGAVDLSLDPFELIGFSRNGALARDNMWVFDARSNGFWPGEGGAFSVLKRERDAIRANLPVLGRIRGCGLSTDGAGGLTRPSSAGQLLACRRACEAAAIDPNDLVFIEAHGTGTAVGDPVEIGALATLREGARQVLPVGSIKANIGHTKAAAGFAGLAKALLALIHGAIPPHVGCGIPHPVFAEVDGCVRPATTPEPISETAALVGVSSFGFGGINAHVVLEGHCLAKPAALPRSPKYFDVELFAFAGATADDVCRNLEAVAARAGSMSISEVTDAAAQAGRSLGAGPVRAAILAAHGSELGVRFAHARSALMAGESLFHPEDKIFVGRADTVPRIGFVFPGQAAPSRPTGGIWPRCFSSSVSLVRSIPTHAVADSSATEIAQPAIMAANLAALAVLRELGIAAEVAVGHSLGEIAALVWGGALTPDAALELARQRGDVMAREGRRGGTMLRVAAAADEVKEIVQSAGIVVACENGPVDTVLAGPRSSIECVAAQLESRGIETTRMSVSHAFHSPDMVGVVPAIQRLLTDIAWAPLSGMVVSTVTGREIVASTDIDSALTHQPTAPVMFDTAMAAAMRRAEVFVEVGPGEGLSRLVRNRGITCLPTDAFGASLTPILSAVAELHVRGCSVTLAPLFAMRPSRTLDPCRPTFIESPCGHSRSGASAAVILPPELSLADSVKTRSRDGLSAVLSVVGTQAGLPCGSFGPDDRFLDTLHLNSLAVTRIVTAAAQALGVRIPKAPTEFANATPRQLADALAELGAFEENTNLSEQRFPGVRPWVRNYGMRWRKGDRNRQQRSSLIRWLNLEVGHQIPTSLKSDDQAGLAIWVDTEFGIDAAEQLIARVLEAAKLKVGHLAICHKRAPVAAFARSFAREGYFQSVRVIDCLTSDANDPRLATILSTDQSGYHEVRLSDRGEIEEPIFVPIELERSASAKITADDVVVVVGGGKGIAAECALKIARYGAAVILLGRSSVDDLAVAATLDRAERSGFRCRYVCADVLSSERLSKCLRSALDEYGAATTLIYAPAVNEPKRLTELNADIVRRTLAPKVKGLVSMLEALAPSLRRLITFGSIIGRIGLVGECHYALANAMQTAATETWAAAGHNRSALAIEWSVWGGVGMGERLGTIERLSSQGVDAISVDDALAAFDRLIAEGSVGTVAVTSRFGPPPDLSLGPTVLPMLRFVDEPNVHFPGTELVIETKLCRGRDIYLDDHMIDGHAVLPAVIALDAMAAAASGLSPFDDMVSIQDVAFNRTIDVPPAGGTVIRTAALSNEDGKIEACVFSESDGFMSPCMKASFSLATIPTEELSITHSDETCIPAAPLYGTLFFNKGRFKRLECLEMATSRRVAGRLGPRRDERWFGPYEPAQFSLLADPGATDAILHALQAAIPHKRVLPVYAERIEIDPSAQRISQFSAVERKAANSAYTFDIVAWEKNGRLAQRWTNVTFRAVGSANIEDVLSACPALAESYLERASREALGDDTIEVSLVSNTDASREDRRRTAIERLALTTKIDRRLDGRLVRLDGGGSLSIAHSREVTIAIASRTPIGCDIDISDSVAEAAQDVLRHVIFEACRKAGRSPQARFFNEVSVGTALSIEGMTAFAIWLPLNSGRRIVAFSRLNDSPALPRSFVDFEVTP